MSEVASQSVEKAEPAVAKAEVAEVAKKEEAAEEELKTVDMWVMKINIRKKLPKKKLLLNLRKRKRKKRRKKNLNLKRKNGFLKKRLLYEWE